MYWIKLLKFFSLIILAALGIQGLGIITSLPVALLSQLNDLLHYPFFFLLANFILVPEIKIRNNIKIALLIYIVILIEVVQPYFEREFSYLDILFGIFGILSGYALRLSNRKIVIILILIYLSQIIITITMVSREYYLQPMINNFESGLDIYRVKNLGSNERVGIRRIKVSDNNFAVTNEMLASPWSGIRFELLLPVNIREYQFMTVIFNNKQSSGVLDLRLDSSESKCIISTRPLEIGEQVVRYNLSHCGLTSPVLKMALYFETNSAQNGYWLDELRLIE